MRNMAVDHIGPFAHGHGERLNNLQLLCTACNSLKGTGTMAQLKKKFAVRGCIGKRLRYSDLIADMGMSWRGQLVLAWPLPPSPEIQLIVRQQIASPSIFVLQPRQSEPVPRHGPPLLEQLPAEWL